MPQQGQPAGLGHLNDGHRQSLAIRPHQIAGGDGTHQRVAHRQLNHRSTHGAVESLEESLAAIADRHLHHLSIRTDSPDALSCRLVGLF